MYFFRDDKGVFVKKKYIYVTDDDKVKEKGLTIVKGNCCNIAKEFYVHVIKQKILDNKFKLYDPTDLLNELKQFSLGKEDMLQKRYRVTKPPEAFKVSEGKEESTALTYQISKRYGQGDHFLVINKRIGVGKGDRYCKIEELKERYGDNWIDQVCFERYMDDLSEFIDYKLRGRIHKTDRKRIV
jgi:DNA polymerase elongation subunit (family B)